jgi:tetratricopeptide (TPR) repeat protein
MRSFAKDIILSIPIILLLFGIITLQLLPANDSSLSTTYQSYGAVAYRADDFKWAHACFDKASQINKDKIKSENIYLMGLSQSALKNVLGARKTMLSVIEEQPDYKEPQDWLINFVLSNRQRFEGDYELVTKILLERINQSNDGGEELSDEQKQERDSAKRQYAQLLIKDKKLEEAIPYLQSLALESPVDRLRLAGVYKQQKNEDLAKQESAIALRFFAEALKKDPGNIILLRYALQAATLNEAYDQGVDLLLAGLRFHNTEPDYRRNISSFYVLSADKEAKKEEPDVNKVLSKLIMALNFGPSEIITYIKLCNFATDEEKQETNKKAMIESLTKGVSPPLLHTLLGVMELKQGNTEEGERYLNFAVDANYRIVIAMNFLAHGLVAKKNPEPAVARKLLKFVMDKAGDKPGFHSTLGHILIAEGKFEEALKEYAIAEPVIPNNLLLLNGIMRCYKELKNEEKFEEYKKKTIQILKNRANPNQQPKEEKSEEENEGKEEETENE